MKGTPDRRDSGGAGELLLPPASRLRVGGIDYLNSRPLLFGLSVALPAAEVQNCVPSELARRLRAGLLDAALVPVAEYFSGPPDYRIVPGVSIASYGAVESIRFFHRVPLDAVERVGLDASSMTSSVLVRLLFREDRGHGRGLPSCVPLSPEEGLAALEDPQPALDGVLLIGDAALIARAPAGWETLDLGTEWTRRTGLPFVYAFWVHRGPSPGGLAAAFRRARDIGIAHIDEIVERGPLPAGMTPAAARRYLQHVIRFDLGPAEIEGLLAFRDRVREAGLLEVRGGGELRFLSGEEDGR